MTTRVRLILIGCSFLALLVGVAAFAVYQASQTVPEFYQQALVIKPAEADEAGDELERRVLLLQNELQDPLPNWLLSVTDQQINGWLSSDLVEKFPDLLPKQMSRPRIRFDDGKATIACQWKIGRFSVVLSLLLRAYLTDEPNEIALQVEHLRAGNLPVPLNDLLEQITEAARESNVLVRWSQQDGDPVALIRLPSNPDATDSSNWVLRKLEVRPGELQVVGESGSVQPRVAEFDGENVNRQ